MTGSPHANSFQESLALEEYRSLRAESADAKKNQQTIFQWSMAASGIVVAGSIAVTRTGSTDVHANSTGYLSAALSFLFVLPTILGCAFGAWLGEVQRMERVGRYIRNQERNLLEENDIRLATPSADTSFIIHWESTLVDGATQRLYGKNRLGSAAACALFTLFYYGALVTALALIFTSSAKYKVAAEWKLTLASTAIAEALLFALILVRTALKLAGSTRPTLDTPAPRASHVPCDVVLPCLDEEQAIEWVNSRIPSTDGKYLINDHSTDQSEKLATANGLTVVRNLGPAGIGNASNLGILQGLSPIICIFDCDGTFDPAWIPALIEPIQNGDLDLVVGERDPASTAWGPLHRITSKVRIRILKRKFPSWKLTDLGSARAIRREVLIDHGIQVAPTEAWSVDLTLKVMKATGSDRVGQVKVPYLPRIGRSKITGTFLGSLRTTVASLRVIRGNRPVAQ